MDPFRLLGPELERVDRAVAARLAKLELDPAAAGALSHARGKRLRARLLLHSTQAFLAEIPEAAIRLAAAVEIVHLASLIHDDIVDSAGMRRGRPSARSLLGDDAALALGDLVFSAGLELACRTRPSEAGLLLVEAVRQMCTGELLQVQRRGDLSLSQQVYLKIVASKTGALMKAACEMGGMVGGGGEAEARALAEFGLAFGTAYQIFDDCSDLDNSQRGKQTGQDLSRGEVTLPLILWLSGDATERNSVELVRLACESEEARAEVVRLVSGSKSLEKAMQRCLEEFNRALSRLGGLGSDRAAHGLRALAGHYAEKIVARLAKMTVHAEELDSCGRPGRAVSVGGRAVEEGGGRWPT